MTRHLLALLVVTATACGSADEPAPAPTPAPAPAEPAPAPAPAKAKPAPKGATLTVEALNADREKWVGKQVVVAGYYSSSTRQGNPVTQINVGVLASPDFEQADGSKTPEILCVANPDDEKLFDGVKQKDALTVTGKVDEADFFGFAKLTDCVPSDGAAPPAGDEGKKAKGGKAGKGGKGKGGKRK